MAAQAGLCLAWSETPKDTFCRAWLTCIWTFLGPICVKTFHETKSGVYAKNNQP